MSITYVSRAVSNRTLGIRPLIRLVICRALSTTSGGYGMVYRSWFLGHFASGNHAAAPVLGKSAWRTAAGVRWPWRSTSQAWL